MSGMGNLLGGNAPLRGRSGLEMVIQPFGYRDAAEFWEAADPKLAALIYSIVGGTPAYRRQFVRGGGPAGIPGFDAWGVGGLPTPGPPPPATGADSSPR